MVQYEVTAELVQATATLTLNGMSQEVSVDIPIAATITASALVEAKQKARESVNLQAATILQEKLVAAGFSPENASLFYKGRVTIDVSLWMKVNITNVQIIQ